jgi:SPP1 family predicted phage head-tail adaptor
MMNHRITLLRRETGTDTVGQPVVDWVDVATVWADVRFQSGAEVLRAGADIAVKRASIRVRARKDIDAAWRVRYSGEEFEVSGPPLPDRDPQFMFLVCESAR